jgi:hypothetical protein
MEPTDETGGTAAAQAGGQAAGGQAPAQTTAPLTVTEAPGAVADQQQRSSTRRTATSPTRKRTNGHAAAAPTDPDSRTISITLPKDVAEWYEKQAAAAPFEPSVARFMAWQLREQMRERQLVEQSASAAQAAAAAGAVPGTPVQ